MKKISRISSIVAATVLGLGVVTAHADDARSLVQSHGCFTCHGMSGTKIGPGFADIAAKFAGKPDARKTVTDAIEHGVSGTAMPANPSLSDADATLIAGWILGLKK